MTRRPGAVTADRGSLRAPRAAYLAGVLAAVTAGLGLPLVWSGIVIRLWSFQTLGRYFTFTVQTSQDQPVISGGPYRVVRHPGYTGLLLALTGLGFFLGNWVSVLCLAAIVTAGLVYRIRVEEGALLQTLGARYRDYAASRKRLVPLIC